MDLFPRSNETDYEKNQRQSEVFENCYKKALAGKMDVKEFNGIMDKNGINFSNASQEAHKRMQNPNFEVSFLDVHIMLFFFIKTHRKDHIFVDEFAIHHSMFCKLTIL